MSDEMHDLQQSYASLDKKFALLEQKIDLLMSNHLTHLAADVEQLKKWWYGAITLLIGNLVAVIFLLLKTH